MGLHIWAVFNIDRCFYVLLSLKIVCSN